MKHYNIKSTALVFFSALIMVLSFSCQKAPINGDLDGQWQVMSVSPEPTESPIDEQLYYCFYLHVCNLTFYGGIFANGNMQFDGKTLYLDFPYITTSEHDNILRQYGINENPIIFTVEHLDKKSLILKHGDTTVTMRKF